MWRPDGALGRSTKLGVATLLLTLAVSQSAAATFKVSPTTVDLSRDPGGAALGTINVRVHGEGKSRFRTVVEEITQRADGTQAYSPASDSRFSASSWVSVTPATFSGAPDRAQPIQYRVAVPPDAEPGDHLASLTVQRLAPSSAATAASIEAVSVRMTIRVRGEVRPEARIISIAVPSIADGGPVSITATVKNSGNVTLDFDRADHGAVSVLDGDDPKTRLPFTGQLFPGQTRVFASSWEDPPLLGDFDAEASVETGADVARRREGFWVIPWRQIGALLLVAAAVLVFALGWRRRRWGY